VPKGRYFNATENLTRKKEALVLLPIFYFPSQDFEAKSLFLKNRRRQFKLNVYFEIKEAHFVNIYFLAIKKSLSYPMQFQNQSSKTIKNLHIDESNKFF